MSDLKQMCEKLSVLLKYSEFFDVSGGCGFDSTHGESSCMDAVGMWFTYCPFCGKKINSQYNKKSQRWEWWEE